MNTFAASSYDKKYFFQDFQIKYKKYNETILIIIITHLNKYILDA